MRAEHQRTLSEVAAAQKDNERLRGQVDVLMQRRRGEVGLEQIDETGGLRRMPSPTRSAVVFNPPQPDPARFLPAERIGQVYRTGPREGEQSDADHRDEAAKKAPQSLLRVDGIQPGWHPYSLQTQGVQPGWRPLAEQVQSVPPGWHYTPQQVPLPAQAPVVARVEQQAENVPKQLLPEVAGSAQGKNGSHPRSWTVEEEDSDSPDPSRKSADQQPRLVRKEAEKIILPALPDVVSFRAWKTTVVHLVVQASAILILTLC